MIVETANANETVVQFDLKLKEFVAAHATTEDRYDLVQQLRTAKKPRMVTVQAFWYRLREINTYVEWLPGAEPPLTEPQQKQAFYDSMPAKWQERFISAGHIAALTMAQMVRYFRQQEALAIRREQEIRNSKKRIRSESAILMARPRATTMSFVSRKIVAIIPMVSVPTVLKQSNPRALQMTILAPFILDEPHMGTV